jgi:hypothetical protein
MFVCLIIFTALNEVFMSKKPRVIRLVTFRLLLFVKRQNNEVHGISFSDFPNIICGHLVGHLGWWIDQPEGMRERSKTQIETSPDIQKAIHSVRDCCHPVEN